MKQLLFVKLPISRFVFEVATNKGNLEDWTMNLAKCLMAQDSSLSQFGASLLSEAEEFRDAKVNAGRRSAILKNQQRSTEVNRGQQTLAYLQQRSTDLSIPSTEVNRGQPNKTSNDCSCIVVLDSSLDINSKNKKNTSTVPAREIVLKIWNAAPKISRTRSSEINLTKAWESLRPEPDINEVLIGLEAWKISGDWTRDGGRYIPGIHRWIKNKQWKNLPDPACTDPIQRQMSAQERKNKSYLEAFEFTKSIAKGEVK
jgi:hypothetical protein